MKMSKSFYFTRFIFGVIFFLSGLSLAVAQTENQKEFRTVKVAYTHRGEFQDPSPLENHRSGYVYEFLQNVAYFAGWKYEYIDTNWNDGIRMLENGVVDIIAQVSKTPERENKMYFSDLPMGMEEYYFYVRRDYSEIKIDDLKSVNGKTVGVAANSCQLDLLRQWEKENNIHCKIIEYQDDALLNQDFLDGKLNAIVSYGFYLNMGWLPLFDIGKSDYYIAVNLSQKEILQELNQAQVELFESSPLFTNRLRNLYFPHKVISEHLNEREKAWLDNYVAKHGKIKLGYVNDYLPYCSKNGKTGNVEGALLVFLDNLKSAFGIEVEAIAYDNYDKMYEDLHKNELAACYPIYNKLWQSEELGIMQTEPVADFPVALFFRKGEFNGVDELKNFAVPASSPLNFPYIRDKYPHAKYTIFKDHVTAMRAVSKGEADAIFINTYILARFYDTFLRYKNIDIAYLPNNARVSFGVNFNEPELLSILNKNAMLIDSSVVTSSLVHNSQLQRSYSLSWLMRNYAAAILFVVFILSGAIVLAILYQFLRIRKEKKRTEEAVEREKEAMLAVKDAFEAANKANAAKTEFLASMSHDIRTPLNAIVGMTAIAAANLGDSEKIQHCLAEITISSKHLLSLINEVLDMNKIESGKVSLNKEEFSLANLVEEFVAVSKPLINGKHQDFIINIHDIKHEKVIGDADRISHCLINFISNAVKYTPENGMIRVSITEKPTNRPKIGCYEFVFEDNGIGMSKDFLSHMFEPFSRAHDKRVLKQQGTGLGMAITRNIIRMMNGDVKVESELNKGSKFTATIFLELQESDEELHIETLSNLPVLVADDDQASCESTCFVLNELGMTSEWVLSGKEAVEKVIQHHADGKDYFAIIVDWKMPEMDGVETSRAIRNAVGDSVPIIIISAYDWSDIESEAHSAGANAFVAKPIFKSRIAHTFLELTGNESSQEEQTAIDKYKENNFNGAHVLLAEDNELNAEIASEILGMAGLKVDVASNGKETVDKLNSCEDGFYKIVFMDIQMPIMDGYEATEKIRASDREYLKTVPIIAMSANAFAEDVQKAKSVGMNEHVAKPLDLEHLLALLKEWVK